MNAPTDTDLAPTRLPGAESFHGPPQNWRQALLLLIASRVSLIELESKDAAKDGARRLSNLIAALVCGVFAWALLVAGLIAFIADAAGWPWYWVAVGTSGLHLLVCFTFLQNSKASGNPAFPLTRTEFQKDREWIENLNTRKH